MRSIGHLSVIRLAGLTILSIALAVLSAGCGTSTSPLDPGGGVTTPLSKVTITPARDSLVAGGTATFTAVAYDTSGHAKSGVIIVWNSLQPAVADVNVNGRVIAISEGVAHIVASAGGKADTATVYVTGTAAGWAVQTSGTAQNLNGVFFQPDGRTGVAVGDAGTLVVTNDAGATWTPGNSNTTADLQSVWFVSSLQGWASGTGGVLMTTTNGGATWTRQTGVNTTSDIACVRFSDALHGWVVGASGLIERTVDGGSNWTRISLVSVAMHSVSFTDSLNGWACGANGTVLGTHDGGASWYAVPLSVASQTLEGVARVNDAVAVAVGTQGTIARSYATTDSLAWATASAGANFSLHGVCMASASTGWAVGANTSGAILVTTDGGATWTPQTAGATQALHSVHFVDTQRGWVVGAGGRILHTSHGGNP